MLLPLQRLLLGLLPARSLHCGVELLDNVFTILRLRWLMRLRLATCSRLAGHSAEH